MSTEIEFDVKTNVALSGGESLVFHCHFYNCALQKAVEEGMGDAAGPVQTAAAAAAVRRQALALGADAARLEAIFRELGFGMLDLSGAGATGGRAVVRASHYAMGWVSVHGERETPVCWFPAGFIAGGLSAAHGLPLEKVRVTESACFANGAAECVFDVEVSS